MIALLRYGSGVPWYRLRGLERSLSIPLPVATQCEIVAEIAVTLQPALEELKRQAAQGEVVHNDDTLKKAIPHRKNSLFYKTRKGAQMGDLFMSLIHTCELNGVNPFDYLTELQRHAEELQQNPSEWMPWNYRETLARLARPSAA
jgi:hypothetical protein